MKLTLREQLAAEFLKGILSGSYSSLEVMNFWNAAAAQEVKATTGGCMIATAFNFADAFLAQCTSAQPTHPNQCTRVIGNPDNEICIKLKGHTDHHEDRFGYRWTAYEKEKA